MLRRHPTEKILNSAEHKPTHFALLPVQVELVLADRHDPNGFNQRVAGIPCVDQKARLAERALGHCSPVAAHTHTDGGQMLSNTCEAQVSCR